MSEHKHSFFYPLVFPFFQERWFSRTWWLGLITMIPVFNLIMLSGWRFTLVRRMSQGEKEILPTSAVLSFLKYGLVLWAMGGVYVLVPILLVMATGSGEIGAIIEVVKWLFGTLSGAEGLISGSEMLTNFGIGLVIRTSIELVWLLVSMPIYRIAMIRYAINGRVGGFLNIPLNAAIAAKYSGRMIMMWVFGFFMVAFIAVTTVLLTATVVLAVIAPIFGVLVYYWSTGFEYGHLAHDMKTAMDAKPQLEDEVPAPLALAGGSLETPQEESV